jgi:tryptophanyl-tRNA synthetase
VESGCRSAGIGCGDCKKKLGENIEQQMAGPRMKKRELLENPSQLDQLIEDGCMRARKEARRQLEAVKEWTGIGISYDYP